MQRGRMLQNNDVVSIRKDLLAGNYQQLLSDLRRIGHPIKQAWLKSPLSKKDKKYQFTSNSAFKEFLVDKIKDSKLAEPTHIENISQHINQLKNQFSILEAVLIVWKDDPDLSKESEDEKKNQRQQIKYKSKLDKDDRYAINIAFQAMVFILCQQSNNFIKHQEKTAEIYVIDHALTEEEISKFKDIGSKQDLLNFISKHVQSLNKFAADRKLDLDEEPFLINKQEIEKIGAAISAFQTPNKKKKLIKYAGISLALIASLACGLSTGGAIFLLFPSLPILGICLGAVIGLFGFSANFGFFSKNFPDFLLNLIKKGGISEYIDRKGSRKQFSATYKYLFTPLAIMASLTVGAGTTALTYITVLGLTTKLLPLLAIIWPPLPLIIVGVLAAGVGIALTASVLTASLELLKNVAALNMGFKELSKHIYRNCVAWFKNLKNLKTSEKVGLGIMLLLLPVALAGLAYFSYTAGVDLSVFIGIAGAIVTGIVAYIPQMAFTYLAVKKFKNLLTITSLQAEDSLPPKSLLSQVGSVFSKIWYWLGLTINAIGNAILVYTGSVISILGAIACAFNSLIGNMSETDVNRNKRSQATNEIVKEYEGLISEQSEITRAGALNAIVKEYERLMPEQSEITSEGAFFRHEKDISASSEGNEVIGLCLAR
jgi:hypothetical protein